MLAILFIPLFARCFNAPSTERGVADSTPDLRDQGWPREDAGAKGFGVARVGGGSGGRTGILFELGRLRVQGLGFKGLRLIRVWRSDSVTASLVGQIPPEAPPGFQP